LRYNFEWDPVKAKGNLRKHRISFERAAELFLDPLAISILDEKHSKVEERWITIGRDGHGMLLVLIHTFEEVSQSECRVRIISARKATRKEVEDYEEMER
jgi:uncharacterized DUF497 family protein